MDELIETYVNNAQNAQNNETIEKLYALFNYDPNYYECNYICGKIEFIKDINYETYVLINTYLSKVFYPYVLVYQGYEDDNGKYGSSCVFKRGNSEKYKHIELHTLILNYLLIGHNNGIRGELRIQPEDAEPFILHINIIMYKEPFINSYKSDYISSREEYEIDNESRNKIFKI